MYCLNILLFHCLDGRESHVEPAHSFADCLGIVGPAQVPVTIGPQHEMERLGMRQAANTSRGKRVQA